MREVLSAKITKIKVCCANDWVVVMLFEGQHKNYEWGFIMSNPVDRQRLTKLMNYTNTCELMELNGKVIRVLIDDGIVLEGLGHPAEDKFVPLRTKEFIETTEAEFVSMLIMSYLKEREKEK